MAKTPYTQYLQLYRIHLFTAVQLVFFIMLYIVKNVKAIAIAFPVMILLCIPARIYLLPRIFTDDELTLLDGAPEAIEAWVVRKRVAIEGAVLKVDDIGDVTDTNELGKLVEENQEGEIDAIDDVDDNVEVAVPNREKQNSTSSQAARARREKQTSVTSVSSRLRRERQTSTSSIDAFFETAYGVPRPRREKQPSVDRSVGGFMERQGLQMPDVVVDETHNEDDAKSDISANL